MDARGIKKTLTKIEEAEKNQEEIEDLIENTLILGNKLLEKVEEFKVKQNNSPAAIGPNNNDVTNFELDYSNMIGH